MPAVASTPRDPAVLSYLALRRAVGFIALGLPFALILPRAFGGYVLPSSISAYYYTGLRNLFEGSLCAIAVINLCCRGYDLQDEIAGVFSALCALGVAFFPTSDGLDCPTLRQQHVGTLHMLFASLLFATLAYFCLVLFRMTASGQHMTRKKRQRNLVYTVCGWSIVASIALIVLCSAFHRRYLIGQLGVLFVFETTSLLSFGVAWLVKGETILRDENTPRPAMETRSARTARPDPNHPPFSQAIVPGDAT